MTRQRGSFRLWKHYLDCVGEDGTVCIGYVAGLRWGPLAVRYAALLECSPDGSCRERHTYTRVPEPEVAGGDIDWECAPLGVSGRWRDGLSPHEAVLLDGPAGSVRWRVHSPRSNARIERTGQPPVSGWGYAERLELTIEPWRLPFQALSWGRFHAAGEALVWIGWEGDVRLRHVLHNGELLADATFGERCHRFDPGCELELLETRVIHEAPVVSALDRLPRILRRVPPGFLAAREVKWLSQARLSTGSRPPASGWALHELVRFR